MQSLQQKKKIVLTSIYGGFQIFTINCFKEYDVAISNTITISNDGSPHQWFCNHNISKCTYAAYKRPQFISYFIQHILSPQEISNLHSVKQLHALMQTKILKSNYKDESIKNIEIQTYNNQILQMSVPQFISKVASNPLGEYQFNKGWRTIKEVNYTSKLHQRYVMSTKINYNRQYQHLIQKYFYVLSGNKNTYNSLSKDEGPQNIQFQVAEMKIFNGYKQYDSFINKQMQGLINKLMKSIETNLNCTIHKLTTVLILNKNKEPVLHEIKELVVVLPTKLTSSLLFNKYFKDENVYNNCFSLSGLISYLRIQVYYKNQHHIQSIIQRYKQLHYQCKGLLCNISSSSSHQAQPQQQRINSFIIEHTYIHQKSILLTLQRQNIIKGDQIINISPYNHFKYVCSFRVCKNCSFLYGKIQEYFYFDDYGNIMPHKHAKAKLKLQKKYQLTPNLKSSIKKQPSIVKQLYKSNSVLITKKSKSILKLPSLANYNNIFLLKINTNPSSNEQRRLPHRQIMLKQQIKTYQQAQKQLINKLKHLKYDGNKEQFIMLAKSYYQNNRIEYSTHPIFYSKQSKFLHNLYQYSNNTPLSLQKSRLIKFRPHLTFKQLAKIGNYSQIISQDNFKIYLLAVNQQTFIPYAIINSQNHNHNTKTIILIHDIFDSFLQYLKIIYKVASQVYNTRFIVFNYPGQSHTLFQESNCLTISLFNQTLEKLLYNLTSSIHQPLNRISFVGIGYGGYLLQQYLKTTPIINDITSKILIINSFASITTEYTETIRQLMQIYLKSIQQNRHFQYFQYNKLINSYGLQYQDILGQIELNDIKKKGRLFLMRGCLVQEDGQDDNGKILMNDKVRLVYSMSNVLIKKEEMLEIIEQQGKQIQLDKLKIVEGGHNILSQNENELIKSIQQLINSISN